MNKSTAVSQAKTILHKRILEFEKAIKNSQDSANQESKSSAGDKYETSRAMAQNDKAMFDVQLMAANTELSMLNSINFDQQFNQCRLGALIKTSIGEFLLAVSLGRIVIDGEQLMVISQESPIGKLLFGKNLGEKVSFNNKEIEILKIY